jgi:glutaredoxin 3
VRAKQLIEHKGLAFKERLIDGDPITRQEMMQLSGRHTVPQIWIGDTHIGGCDELFALERAGELDSLVKSTG